MNEISLKYIKNGQRAIVKKVLTDDSIKRRLLDIGLTPGTIVENTLQNFNGELVAYMIRGALIAIRDDDAAKIIVEEL